MAFFSEATLEQIRAASDIVDVIGSYLPLKRAGANFVALCPFHKEKSPSFNVNPHRQIFHCFGCHKGGDVFTFVKEYESIDFVEAVKRLADRAKIPLELEKGPGGEKTAHIKETLLKIHEQIAQRWHNCLLNESAGQLGRDYLNKRGVSDEAIKLFRIGAAPEAWDDTVNWAKSKDFDMETMEKSGLVIRKEGTDRYYDRFRGRLMFPICDEQGRVIGFSGRVLSGDEKTAKYVNSPETPIFTKSKVFFGLDKSKRAILDAGYAIVCEGQLDLIACFMAGVQNIVAPQGTAFTDQHSRILKRYVDEVVLCFDSDTAGQNAAVRSLDHLLASGLAVRVAVVPAPHDPDSFIKEHGGIAFKNLIHGADGFFDYYLNRLCATNDTATDKGRLGVLRGMAEAVYKTGNGVLIDKYAQKTALKLGVTPEAVRAEFKKLSHAKLAVQTGPEDELVDELATETQRPSREEFGFLKLLFEADENVALVSDYVDPAWIEHDGVARIVAMRIREEREGSWRGLPQFLDSLGSDVLKNIVTEAVSANYMVGATDHQRGRTLPNPARDLQGFAIRMRNSFLKREISRLNALLSELEPGEAKQIEVLRELQKLNQLTKSPLVPLQK